MFYKTSVYITDILEQQNKFAPEDKEVYRYGIQQYSQTIRFQAYKGTYCEIAPATLDYANYSLYYYGNDPDLAAYATIESDCA